MWASQETKALMVELTKMHWGWIKSAFRQNGMLLIGQLIA